ncbi:MAG: cytochrome P450 [Natronosporangium sp.]
MGNVYRYGHEEPYRLDPTPLYAILRSDEPVARVTTPYGDDGWLVTRHDSVKTVLHDPRFSRAAAVRVLDRLPRASAHVPKVNPLSACDPPEHSRLRQLVAGAFTKHKAQQHRPRAEEIANQLIDELVAAGRPADLTHGFARRFPILSLAEILGIPRTDCIRVKEWTAPIVTRHGHTETEISAAHARLEAYLTTLLARRREQPEDDLITALVQSQGRKNRYTDDELVFLLGSLLINDSVPSHLASALYLLLTNPDQLAWLRANPDRMPHAVDELLRFAPQSPDSPSAGQGHVRFAIEDVEIDGVKIQAGEWVLPSIISANRDERTFTDADRLDLTRTRNRHIAFGFGTHHCPGAALSRMQLQVAFSTVLDRFPRLALAIPGDQVPWKAGRITRGPERLPVTW